MCALARKLWRALFLLLLSGASLAQVWQPITGAGSPGYGNDVRGYSSAPEGPNAWWIATDGGGVYKTTDAGTTWQARNSGIGHLRTVHLWITGSALPYKVIASSTGGGVYVSTESSTGNSGFTAMNSGLGCTYVRAVRVLSSGRWLAATDCGKSSGIYYSDNSGGSWAMATGLASDNITVFSTSYINPSVPSGTTFTPYLLANTSLGIYKSTDSGATWTALPSSPTGPNGSLVYSVTYSYDSTATPALRLLATVEGAGVFKSDDAGTTWAASNSGLPSGVIVPMSSVSQDGAYSATSTFYLALDGVGTYKSTNRGASWSLWKSEAELPSVRQIAHRYSPTDTSTNATADNKKILWASTQAGPYVSKDAGVSWTKAQTSLPSGIVANVGFDTINDLAYASAVDGVYKLTNASSSSAWTKLPGLPKLNHLIVRGSDVWAATSSFGVYKLPAGAATWTPVNQGLPAAMVYKNAILRLDPLNSNGWYVGLWGSGVYYYDGTSWAPRNNGLAGDALKVRFMTTYADRILLSTQAGLYLSTNNGQSWTQMGPKDSSGNWIRPGHTAVLPSSPNTFYLSVYNTDPVAVSSAGNGLWKSTDAGTTWQEVSYFSGRRINDVRVLRMSVGEVLGIASWDDNTTTGGLFASMDNGQSWASVNAGLNTTLVAAVNTTYDGPPVVSSRAGLYFWGTPLGLHEKRTFVAVPSSTGGVKYIFAYSAKGSSSALTGLTLTAAGKTAVATSSVDADGVTTWNATIDLGSTVPASTVTYTATIATPSGSKVDTVTGDKVNWTAMAAPSGIQPNSNSFVSAGGTVNVTWLAPTSATASTQYMVHLLDASTQATLWSTTVGAGYAPSAILPSSNLTAGRSYELVVTAVNAYPLTNIAVGTAAVETFCYACGTDSRQAQTITISVPPVLTVGGNSVVTATATSGLAVQLASTTTQICSVSNGTVTAISAGTCALTAMQAGNNSYKPASAGATVQVVAAGIPTPPVNWKPVANGPGYGGVVRSTSTSIDGQYWIATEGGGLHVSADGGSNWTAMNNGIVDTRLWGLAISQPSSGPYKIWVASYGGGVYYSADSGKTFNAANSGLSCTYARTVRLVGARLFATTDCGDRSGVYYSDNDGQSWSLSTGAIPVNVRVNSLTNVNPSGQSAYLLANTTVGIFKSTDNGASFAALTASPGLVATQTAAARQNTYGVTWSSSGSVVTLLATVEGLGVYRSTDGGSTWSASNTGLPTTGTLVPMSSVTTNGSGTFYLALDRFGVYKSVDQGATWSAMAADAVLPSARYVGVANANGAMYAATQAGPYFSADGGLNWVKAGAGLPGGMLSNVVFLSNGDSFALAADGAYKLNSATQAWGKVPGLPSTRSTNLVAVGSDVYAGTDSYGVYKLVNGSQWVPMNTGLPAGVDLVYATPSLRVDSDTPGALWLGLYGKGVYYYDPSSASWSARNSGLSSSNAQKVRHMSVRGSILMLSTEAGLYVSTDKGQNWLASGLKDVSGAALRADHVAISNVNPNTFYAAVYNTDATGNTKTSNGLWVSVDKGVNWTQVQALAGLKLHDVRAFSDGQFNIMTAAAWDMGTSKAGLWVSQDNGSTWFQFNSGLSNYYVNGVFVDAVHDGPGYVTTRGGGLFAYDGSPRGSSVSLNDWRYFGTFTWLDASPRVTYYHVNYGANDPANILSSITLTNGSESTTATNRNNGEVNAGLDLGNTVPAATTTYTAVQAFTNGAAPVASTFQVRSQGWATNYPSNIGMIPASCSTCLPQISWAASSAAEVNTRYNVTVYSGSGSSRTNLWSTDVPVGNGTSVSYTGPALINGGTYDIYVTAQTHDISTSTAYGATGAVTYTVGGSDQRQTQTISFTAVNVTAVGATATLTATAPGGAVTFSSTTNNTCSVVGNTLVLFSPGACVVNALQAGSTSYKPAIASQTINVGGSASGTTPQVVTFNALTSLTVGGSVNLSATAPGGAVTFSSQTTSVCTVSGSTLTAISTGACAVLASQAGTATYQAASAAQYIVISEGSTPTTTTVGSATTTTALSAQVTLVSGWNLIGNGFNFGIDVATIFGDKSLFVTVWKWVAASNSWAFYTPLQADGGAAYAVSKGYSALTTINPGEGFWVNASAQANQVQVDLRSDQTIEPTPFVASNFALGGPNQLPSAWSLIAVGERKTPKEFNQAYNLFAGPPTVGGSLGSVAENVTSLWSWDVSDPSQPGWLFYAPKLENSGTLGTYITTKGYHNFGSNKLSPTTGFWVNMP